MINHWRLTLNSLLAGIATHYSNAEPVGTHPKRAPKKRHSRPDNKQYPLLPYLAQLIIRSIPSLQGSAILFASTVRQCNDNLALEVHN